MVAGQFSGDSSGGRLADSAPGNHEREMILEGSQTFSASHAVSDIQFSVGGSGLAGHPTVLPSSWLSLR